MYSEMDCYWESPPTTDTYPVLLECDSELVKNTLQLILDSTNKRTTLIPESKQIVCALNNYIKECNTAFLANERIRNFLLFGLFANLIVSFIVLVSIPVTVLSISLICFVSLILFSVNLFTLYQQMQEINQENAKNILKKSNARFMEITNSNIRQKKFLSPTSALCLFPEQKISQNDEFKQNRDKNYSNGSGNSLHLFDENLVLKMF